MKILTILLLFVSFKSFNQNIKDKLLVYMSPTCGCCSYWVKHMETNGFIVEEHKISNVNTIKTKAKITTKLASCHTAFIDGYVIEGHVPSKDVKKLLSEKADIKGLTVPGMPAGSNVPGMEVKKEPANFDVLAIQHDGSTRIWSHYE